MNKEIRNTLAWIVCATCVMGLAIWRAQISIAQDLKARQQTLPPPLKSRYAIRTAPVSWAGDPVADYNARCKKGLTDQEIGWIIEDFQNAVLDAEITDKLSWKELFAFRIAQHRWYHDALVDGLRLNAEQSAEVTAKLGELFDLAKANFVEASGGPKFAEINGIWKDTNDGFTEEFASASGWLIDKSDPFAPVVINRPYQPWNLCSLTPDQQTITWKQLDTTVMSSPVRDTQDNASRSDADAIHEQNRPELLLSGPTPNNNLISEGILPANYIFPFTRHQELQGNEGRGETTESGLLSKVRLLHPAQLKTLLLFKPDWAGKIQQALETTNR